MKKNLFLGIMSFLVVLILMAPTASAIQLAPTDDTWAISKATVPGAALALGTILPYSGYLETSSVSSTGYVNTFLQFDLSAYTGIDSAILYLYDYASQGASLIRTYRVPNNWDETTLTGLNQPTYNPFDPLPPVENTVSGIGWKSWNVTAFADAAVSIDGILSLELKSFTYYFQRYYSDESPNVALRPYLDVTPTAPVPEPASILLLGLGLVGLAGARKFQR